LDVKLIDVFPDCYLPQAEFDETGTEHQNNAMIVLTLLLCVDGDKNNIDNKCYIRYIYKMIMPECQTLIGETFIEMDSVGVDS